MKILRVIFLGIGTIVFMTCSSCTKKNISENNVLSSTPLLQTNALPETSTKQIFTITNYPSKITNTNIPTNTHTLNIDTIKLNTFPERIDLYTKITMDDITSGRFAEANLSIAKPFPELAQRAAYYTRLVIGGGPAPFLYINYLDNVIYSTKKDVDILPQKWLSFNTLSLNNKEVILAGLQIINKDGTYGVVNVIVDDRPIKEFIKTDYWQYILKAYSDNKMEGMIIRSFSLSCENQAEFMSTKETCENYEKHPEISKYLDQWININMLPKQLNRQIVGAYISIFW